MTQRPSPWTIKQCQDDPPRFFVLDADGIELAIFVDREDAEYVVTLINDTNAIGAAVNDYVDAVKEMGGPDRRMRQ